MNLTDMQKRYIWLMGSFPDKVMVQGRGYRTAKTMWRDDGEEIVIFGYSNPPEWLERRGLIRALQAPRTYVLTDAGEAEFKRLLTRGDGLWINREIREVRS